VETNGSGTSGLLNDITRCAPAVDRANGRVAAGQWPSAPCAGRRRL